MENVINEMADNLKGFQASIEAKLEATNAEIRVVKDEAQKQFDAQAAAQKKNASKQVKFLDEAIIEKLDGKMDEMEKSMKSNGNSVVMGGKMIVHGLAFQKTTRFKLESTRRHKARR